MSALWPGRKKRLQFYSFHSSSSLAPEESIAHRRNPPQNETVNNSADTVNTTLIGILPFSLSPALQAESAVMPDVGLFRGKAAGCQLLFYPVVI